MKSRTVLTCLVCVCLMYALAALVACATGSAKGGDTSMERSEKKPKTRRLLIETFGREPSPEEWATLRMFGQEDSK